MSHITKKRILLYALGLIILAAGLTLNTKADLGVSPIVSVSYCIFQLSGINFGDATFFWYCILVLMQIVIHIFVIIKEHRHNKEDILSSQSLRQKLAAKIIPDLLQILVSLIFTRIVNFFSAVLPDFGAGSPMKLRLLVLAAAVIFTGVGAVLSVDMRIIPNPGDGIVQTISDVSSLPIGTAKNLFDVFCVMTTLIISLLFGGRIIGIGIGTVIAALGVGRVMAAFNKITGLDHQIDDPTSLGI